jgi:hypothetical protein
MSMGGARKSGSSFRLTSPLSADKARVDLCLLDECASAGEMKIALVIDISRAEWSVARSGRRFWDIGQLSAPAT